VPAFGTSGGAESSRDRRRLVAVLYVDMIGYSHLIGLDDVGTLKRLSALRRGLIDPAISEHDGRIVQTGGDSLLVVFDSIDGAVRCAIKVQQQVPIFDADQSSERAIRFRAGIDIGDAIPDGTDLHGEAVNVAVRLQAICPPGEVCVSRSVRDNVHGRLGLQFDELGAISLKNITRPIEAFVVRSESAEQKPRIVAPATSSLPDKPSIAVLPFANFSSDLEQDYFADGMVEDILTALARFNSLLVVARNSSSIYQGRSVDVKQVGRELGVRYALEGSVRKVGDRVRVTVQLLETVGGHHIWADRYDRRLDDIFALQDEVTASIVGRINPEILSAEFARVSRKTTPNLNAWECVVRAFHHCSQQSEPESRRALEFLDDALRHAPDYAQALGMRAWILVFRALQGWEDMRSVLEAVVPMIAQAMAVDNDELWPHLAQGMVGYAIRDNALSMAALTRAVELSPNSVNAHGLLGNAHSFGGRSKEALSCIQHARRLSPRDTYLSDFELYSAFAHFQGASYELGLQFAQQGHRLRPGHPYPLLLGASCAGHLGELAAGSSMLGTLRAIAPFVSRAWVETTSPYVLPEDRIRFVDGLVRLGLE
jgi:adenylate cyclase